ncbi:MAG TPA: serine/threonine protein kinase [Polyangiaceae bacterium]|nr:serine/threonine protein kinase [Polyangiaceae bacterium]
MTERRDSLPLSVGPYEPLELLAEGGMARVVVAKRSGLAGFERQVALKLILPELASDPKYVTMFLDEARMASRVQHPNVVSVLEVGRDEASEILYMAMELVLGATLSQVGRAAPGAMPAAAALEIVAQAADGLDAAHCATDPDGAPLALVHRDICPQNLLLGFDGFVRVSDFGIARAERRSTRTETGKFKGKLGYCSPEHVLAKPVDHRSDLFALGIVAFELITGRRLFSAKTPSAILQQVLHADIPPITAMRPDVPPAAAAVINRALSRDPDARPARGSVIAETIRAACIDAGLDAPGESIRAHVRVAATDQAVRLAGMDARRYPSAPPAPMGEPSTTVQGTLRGTGSRDTIVDAFPAPFDDE